MLFMQCSLACRFAQESCSFALGDGTLVSSAAGKHLIALKRQFPIKSKFAFGLVQLWSNWPCVNLFFIRKKSVLLKGPKYRNTRPLIKNVVWQQLAR